MRAMAKKKSISRSLLDNYAIAFEMMDHDQDGIVSLLNMTTSTLFPPSSALL